MTSEEIVYVIVTSDKNKKYLCHPMIGKLEDMTRKNIESSILSFSERGQEIEFIRIETSKNKDIPKNELFELVKESAYLMLED